MEKKHVHKQTDTPIGTDCSVVLGFKHFSSLLVWQTRGVGRGDHQWQHLHECVTVGAIVIFIV